MTEPMVLRERTEADDNFIFASWLKSYWRDGVRVRIGPNAYFLGQHQTITSLLERPAVRVTVAAAPDGPEIYGWICYQADTERLILHYAYTKFPFRNKFRIFRTLFDHAIVQTLHKYPQNKLREFYITHATAKGLRVLDHLDLRNKYGIRHNPYWAHLEPQSEQSLERYKQFPLGDSDEQQRSIQR